MCDTKKYSDIYNEILKLQPEDTLELVKKSKDKDEQEFFELISNYLLRKKQRTIVENNLF